MRIEGSAAHHKAQIRWLEAEGEIRAVLEKLNIMIDYDDVTEFAAPVAGRYLRSGVPHIEPATELRLTAGIVGLAVALAVVFVEQDRNLRETR